MKFNKAMTKFLSALIMASMVGTSVQIPTLAEITNAGQAAQNQKILLLPVMKTIRKVKMQKLKKRLHLIMLPIMRMQEAPKAKEELRLLLHTIILHHRHRIQHRYYSRSQQRMIVKSFGLTMPSPFFHIMGQSKQLQLPPQMVTVMILYGKLNRNSFHFQSRESKATRVPSILLGTAKQ